MQENPSCLLISSCCLCCWSLAVSRALVRCSRESKSGVWGEGQYHEFTLPPSSVFLLYVSILVWVKTPSYVTNLNTACVSMCMRLCLKLTEAHMISRLQQGRVSSSSSFFFTSSLSFIPVNPVSLLCCFPYSPSFPPLSIYPAHFEHRPLSVLISHSPSRCPTYLDGGGWGDMTL